MHRGLWLLGCGKEPFFPLCPCRTAGPTRPENSARLPPPRHTAYAPSGIIHIRSQHSVSGLQDFCSNSLHAAHFVARNVYDTVVLAGLQSFPGIRAAGWVSILPLGGEGSVTGLTVPGAAHTNAETPVANYRAVSPDYFSAMGIPLLQGRVFGPRDRDRKIVIVSQSVAERFWAGKNPIGQICVTQWGPDVPAEVVGVVGDIRTVRLDEPALMMVYVPHWFNSISVPTSASIVLRTASDRGLYVG